MPTPDYDVIRRGLAEAMEWRYQAVLPPDKFPHISPGRKVEPCPDPLNDAEDAEALEAWLVGQGLDPHFFHDRLGRQRGLIAHCRIWRGKRPVGAALVKAEDEPDPAHRRRRALVEAAWQAVQRARS